MENYRWVFPDCIESLNFNNSPFSKVSQIYDDTAFLCNEFSVLISLISISDSPAHQFKSKLRETLQLSNYPRTLYFEQLMKTDNFKGDGLINLAKPFLIIMENFPLCSIVQLTSISIRSNSQTQTDLTLSQHHTISKSKYHSLFGSMWRGVIIPLAIGEAPWLSPQKHVAGSAFIQSLVLRVVMAWLDVVHQYAISELTDAVSVLEHGPESTPWAYHYQPFQPHQRRTLCADRITDCLCIYSIWNKKDNSLVSTNTNLSVYKKRFGLVYLCFVANQPLCII